MKLKHKDPLFKSVFTKVEDVDKKGVVKFYASIFNTRDRVGDIVVPGAYKKTITENFKEIQHYKNHRSDSMPGVLIELKEDALGLLATSKLILDTQEGAETYAQYKAMAEAGKSMSHSIGYVPVKEDALPEANYLKEIMLFEVSTLTMRPAHPAATQVDVKALIEEIGFLDALLRSDLPDMKLEELEKMKHHIEALIASRTEPTPLPNEPLMKKSEILKILLGND